jgi:hypothetical protein
MLRKAAVLRGGGGNEMGPPIRGVRRASGEPVSPVHGVRPVWKLDRLFDKFHGHEAVFA